MVWRIRVHFIIYTFGLVSLLACTAVPVAKPPVVDASWKAKTDDRIVTKAPSPVSESVSILHGPDRSREKGETNITTAIDPVARIEPIDKPNQKDEILPAVLSLLQQADELRDAGDLAGASARLERAQRIAPTEPEIYYQLSSLRLAETKLDEAIRIATQGIDLAGTDQAMKRDLYNLIARAKDALGDKSGATKARQFARKFGS